MTADSLYETLAFKEHLKFRSDFLKRDEAYKYLIESSKTGDRETFDFILTDLLFDLEPPLKANRDMNEEEVMDFMLQEMEARVSHSVV